MPATPTHTNTQQQALNLRQAQLANGLHVVRPLDQLEEQFARSAEADEAASASEQPLHPELVEPGTSRSSSGSSESSSSSSGSSSVLDASTSEQQQQQAAAAAAPSASGSDTAELIAGIPNPVLVISLVSGSLTMASCVFNTLLPIYLVSELKMTMHGLGMFEGMLEAFSYVVRMFSGVMSDMMTSRKSVITLGFAMGAMAKFGMSGATTVGSIFASKAVDRLANGVQAAPRDAMISDLAPSTSRSSCFGFAQSMRKWGSFVGAGSVFLLMKATNNNYQLIFTLAAGLSLASTVAFVLMVPAHARPIVAAPAPAGASSASSSSPASGSSPAAAAPQQPGFRRAVAKFAKDVASMGTDFYRMLLVVSLYGLGHISEALLESRAMEVGFGKAESTLIVASLAFVTFCAAYPLGRLDDKYGPRVTFGLGMAALVAGDLVLLASGTHPWAVFASLLFMGVHMGVIQGPLLSIVVGLAPPHLRGTAFGIFYTVMAFTALGANALFGSLWHSLGATHAFGFGAAMSGATLLALPWLLPKSTKDQPEGEAKSGLKPALA
jgi:MFS family permease